MTSRSIWHNVAVLVAHSLGNEHGPHRGQQCASIFLYFHDLLLYRGTTLNLPSLRNESGVVHRGRRPAAQSGVDGHAMILQLAGAGAVHLELVRTSSAVPHGLARR